jgi:hypothetical protein
MPPAPIGPDHLRERAANLKRLASRIDDASALDLHRRADGAVWIGPTPQRCHGDLLALRITLQGATRDLRTSARALELRADQLPQP